MQFVHSIVQAVAGFVWGPVMIVLLVGTGIYLTIRLRVVQITRFGHAWAVISGKYDRPEDAGDVTHFQALCTALSATVGIGNIAGVATAVGTGGPGAIVWMWLTAFVGMATKFASCTLGQRFRVIHEDGSASGGPMYYIEQGMGKTWKPLAVLFAACTAFAAFGAGNMVQAHEVANAFEHGVGIPVMVTGPLLAFLVAIVIIGGIRRIASVADKLIPAMAVMYCSGAALVLILNSDKIGDAFGMILFYAVNPMAAAGGFLGATLAQTITWGVKRGLFSNEAGMGSAPMAHAAARTTEPVREGMVAMLGPFIDTIIICTMTGLTLVITGAWQIEGLSGAAMTSKAFELGLSSITTHGGMVVTLTIGLFAYSTILGWGYYGDRAVEYLFGEKAVVPYRFLYVGVCLLGAFRKSQFVWDFADMANGMMTIPNLIALLALSGPLSLITKDYIARGNGARPGRT